MKEIHSNFEQHLKIMDNTTQQFVEEHKEDNIHELALKSHLYPSVNMAFVIRQIHGKQKVKDKIPLFFENKDILYPVSLSLEQSSSESTAKYKSSLCEGDAIADLTGGFGVDSAFFSKVFKQVSYVERNPELCELATHNFEALGRKNIQVFNTESEYFLTQMEPVDWIFIDPARRDNAGNKKVLMNDCEPDILQLNSLLLEKARNVMIKLSPMIDLLDTIRSLKGISDIYVVSVDNECKEVLVIMAEKAIEKLRIHAINIRKNKPFQEFHFNLDDENKAVVECVSSVGRYLYEPNSSVMKSGAFKYIGMHFELSKLHINTHLYTSDKLLVEFPGRVFEVQNQWRFSKQALKNISKEIGSANISTRNFPLKPEELRKKLRIGEGGENYIFGCILADESKVLLLCRKVLIE